MIAAKRLPAMPGTLPKFHNDNGRSPMKLAFFAPLALAALSAGAARADDVSAADKAALTAPVQHLADSINAGNAEVPQGVFAPGSVVLDDFAPFHWTGKTDGAGWYRALVGTTHQQHGDFLAMKGAVKIGEPAFARIQDNNAYVVYPSTFDFTENGKRIHQMAEWLFTEQRIGGKWLITGHTWAITAELAAQ